MTRFTARFALPVLIAALLLSSCDDPTVVEGHIEAEGFAIMDGTDEIYRYMLSEGTPSAFTLAVGAHEVAFVLLDADGNPIPHEGEEEEEEALQVTIGDASILTWTPEAELAGEVHEIEEFHGELDALQAGSTTMAVCVLHGAHCDFSTPEATPVPVTVTQ